MTKDIAKSIKAKLLNIAKKEELDYQQLIIRYLYERLLYRLSASPYKDKFCLKGGALLYRNRNTSYLDSHPLFTDSFIKDENRNTQWKRFLKKIKYEDDLSFEKAMNLITSRLKPIYETLREEKQ